MWALEWLGLAMLRVGRLDEAASVQERALRIASEREDILRTSLLTEHPIVGERAQEGLDRVMPVPGATLHRS